MIKLVASDVDGTLVPEGTSHIDPELMNHILEMKEQGIVFAAASGRQYPSVFNAFSPIKDDIMIIADNGAYVFKGEELLLCRSFPEKTWKAIITYCRMN
ncbi:MAG: HAD family phosphatase, partial [Parasporobacterium sp.]|nr:HAD family phosphatase [Parasporobacterium sp.]